MTKRPNVLFIFSDQQRHDTVSCYGEPLGAHFNLTPNLDRLAAEGTRFERAMTCQPVCGPARACIQTGKYPTEIGCEVNDRMLPLKEKGIASYFNEAGYETAYVGKWHLASHHSFKPGPESIDYKTAAIPEKYRGGYKDFWIAADVLEFTSHGYGGYMYDGEGNRRDFTGYRADATTDFALEYLQKPKSAPFFLFISYIEPHHQNDRNCFEGPEGSRERYRDFPIPGDLAGTGGDWREQIPDYLGQCHSLDENVGRLVDELKRQGIYEDTVILYTSDHGSHFCTRNREYKRSCQDDSLHVPFIAKGGIFDGGHVVQELSSLIDIAPTLLTAAGIPVPEQMRGIPMQRLLEQPGVPTHEEVFVQISESGVGRALRTPDWTYCVEAPEGTDPNLPSFPIYEERYLYDLHNDPYQRVNLAADPSFAGVREKLREKLLGHIKKEEGQTPEIRCAQGDLADYASFARQRAEVQQMQHKLMDYLQKAQNMPKAGC